MLVVHGSRNAPGEARHAVLAIGNFDGVHRGHQALLAAAVSRAKELGAPSGAMVFDPHPRQYFHPDEPHFWLTPQPRKLALLERQGIDVVIVEPFDAELSHRSADEFISGILVGRLAVRHVIIGYDFFFGAKRGGNADVMRAAGERFGFGVTVISPVAEDGEVFSSSAIRLRLASGDVQGAAHMLGTPWRVAGRVVGGARRGTGLGFPTANVPMPRGTVLGHGIYAVRVYLDGQTHDGAAYLGTRPTFDDGMPVLEVFLFDFDGDLYGREIEVEFIGFVRSDRKFDTPEDLVKQMERDVARARAILAEAGEANTGL
jgi:riboflavin kinase/FMN adenylyltransferase